MDRSYQCSRTPTRNVLQSVHGKNPYLDNIALNRKVLADLAMNNPDAFKAIVDKIK